MSKQERERLTRFPNEPVAKITGIAGAKIERMLLQKYGKSLIDFRVYQRRKFPYLVAARLKNGTFEMLVLQ